MGPSDTDGSTNKVSGRGVGISVGVGRRVGVGIRVWVGMAVAVGETGAAVGAGEVPHPPSSKKMNIVMIDVRSI